MKELSIEEKAKAYDEALNRAKKELDACGSQDCDAARQIFRFFQELRESEDEKIRKALISFLKSPFVNENITDEKVTPWIVWLEKQGVQKPAVEMKTPEESLGIDPDTYNKIVDECIYGEQKPSWSEEDELHIRELEGLVKRVWAIAEHENDKDTIHEMSDLSFFLKTLKPQPKQEWSEGDKRIIDNLISQLGNLYARKLIKEETKDKYVNWLKSLRPQSTWKPSDEQMAVLNEVINYAANSDLQHWSSFIYTLLKSLREQLKKLKE